MITVANIRHTQEGVYIGRAMPGRPGSPLGNPYRLVSGVDRSVPLERYRGWLAFKMYQDTPQRKELIRLAELARQGDLVLLCWCAPLACHGDIVKEFIERFN